MKRLQKMTAMRLILLFLPLAAITPPVQLIYADDASAGASPTDAVSTPASTEQPPAQSKISEAFGMKLGDMFDPTVATVLGTTQNGIPEYQFAPTNGLGLFTEYHVLITPQTHRIFAICAAGKFETPEIAQSKQAVIMKLLGNKYGAAGEQELGDISSHLQHIQQGTRGVLTAVDGFTTAVLSIQYIDFQLCKLATKERIEMEAKKIDSGGL